MTIKILAEGDEHYLPPGSGNPCLCRSEDGFLCTRERGHDGDHAAHGHDDRQIVRWREET